MVGWTVVCALAGAVACAASEDGGGAGGAAGTAGSAGNDAGGAGGQGGSAGTAGSAGSAGSSGNDAGGAAGAGGGDAGFDAGPTVTVSGQTVALSDLTTPIADFKVCVYQQPAITCVKSDAQGYFFLTGVPASTEVLLEFTKEPTQFPVLRTVTTTNANTDIGSIGYPTKTEANLFAFAAGTTIDPTKGQVLISAFQPGSSAQFTGQDGVTATMTPMSGSGPFYVKDSQPPAPDKTLTATSTLGFGLFANTNPGTVEIDMVHPTKTCTQLPLASWKASKPSGSKVPVVAGYLTGGAAVLCQ